MAKAMKGRNEISLCSAEMVRAMQGYVDELMPHAHARVVGVKMMRESGVVFIIELDESEEEMNR